MAKRPIVKVSDGDSVFGTLKYADLVVGKYNPQIKLTLVVLEEGHQHEDEEIDVYCSTIVGDLLAGEGYIQEAETREGKDYLKVVDNGPIAVGADGSGKSTRYWVEKQDGERLSKQQSIGKKKKSSARSRKAVGSDPESVRAALATLTANMLKAVGIAEDKGFTEQQASTLFIEMSRMGVDCAALDAAEKSSKRRGTKRKRKAAEPEQGSLDDPPEALEEEGEDDLPF